MRKRIVLSVLSVVATLTATAPLAHAGGGMGNGAGVTTCRLVNGAPRQPQIVSLTDDFPGTDVMNIGQLALLCDIPASGNTVTPEQTGGTGQPVLATEQTSVACYTVGKADKAAVPVTVTDTFTRALDPNGTYGVTVGAINLVCVPAVHTTP
jgi:hypothetical protein